MEDLPGADDGDDDEDFTAPLPADDRLWRHPSEVGGELRSRLQRPNLKVVGVAATASAVLGSLLTVGLLVAVGAFRGRVIEERVVEQPPGPEFVRVAQPGSTSVDAADIARQTEPALARVDVVTPLGPLSGTAVAVEDGYLVTSADLLRRADPGATPVIVAPDGDQAEVEVVAIDRYTNLAVLRAGGDLRQPAWGTAEGVVAGADVFVVGAAEANAKSASVSRGVANAVDVRTVLDNGVTLHDLVRLDANMLPGTRGGVALDANGLVVGLVSTIGRDDAGSERIGFVTPIDVVRTVAERIIRFGRPSEVWLGIDGRSVTHDEASALPITGGALVESVVPGGPADVAGLAVGDVISAIDGTAVDTFTALILRLRESAPGSSASITVLRGGESTTLPAILGKRTDSPPPEEAEEPAPATPGAPANVPSSDEPPEPAPPAEEPETGSVAAAPTMPS